MRHLHKQPVVSFNEFSTSLDMHESDVLYLFFGHCGSYAGLHFFFYSVM